LAAEQRAQIVDVCKVVVARLRMAAADETHAAHSYAEFLEGAISRAVADPPMPAPITRPPAI
jgi:hypothetical protein